MIEIKIDKNTAETSITMNGSGFDVFKELMQAINSIVAIINKEFNIPYDKIYETVAEIQPMHNEMVSNIQRKELMENDKNTKAYQSGSYTCPHNRRHNSSLRTCKKG